MRHLASILHALALCAVRGRSPHDAPPSQGAPIRPARAFPSRHEVVPDAPSIAWSERVHNEQRNVLRRVEKTGTRHLPFKAWLTGGYVLTLAAYGLSFVWFGAGNARREKAHAPDAAPSGASESQPLVSAPARSRELTLAVLCGVTWMGASVAMTLFNKWLYMRGGFPCPLTLTAMHAGSCFAVFGACSWLPPGARAVLMPDVGKHIPWDIFFRELVPAGIFWAVALGGGNMAFLHGSVVFVQMIKPATIVITTLATFALGLEARTLTHMILVMVVAAGIFLAAFHIADFSLTALICKLVACSTQGCRLALLQSISQGKSKLDPLTLCYRLAPIAGVVVCIFACTIEPPVEWHRLAYPWALVGNCLCAVVLNILTLSVIKTTSAMAYAFVGVGKDVITVIIASFIFTTHLRTCEIIGYSMSIGGILMYKVYKDNLALFVQEGFLTGVARVSSKTYVAILRRMLCVQEKG